jgi:hypothetical protein
VVEERTNVQSPPISRANGTQHAVSVESPATRQVQSRSQKLQFLQLAEWDKRNSYGEDVPTCLHYSIEWKVPVNNKVISKATEQDLVLAPMAYWHMFLKSSLASYCGRRWPKMGIFDVMTE